MNCFKCQTPLPDGAKFCFACGTDVSGEHTHETTLAVEQDPELLLKLRADVGTEYVIERELGRGGMAIVYLGHDALLGRKVAVKLLPPDLTFGSSSIIERFKREARTSATLDHPNIIPVYRVSQGQKLFWYVMKFLEGESLDHILEREGEMSIERTIEIVRQTADALDYAHKHNVIHRDIKPANLSVDASGRVTVTDFGIAKALDANTLTASGSMIGTPYYMSPEQCSGKRVGPASDQYSLAIMTYQMLAGHLPFTGDSVVDIVRKHVMDPVPPLAVLRPQLPAALVATVERGLAKDPGERFASCGDFAKVLAQAAQGLEVTVALPTRPGGARPSKTELLSPVPGALRTAKGRWLGRRARVVAGVTVLVIGAAAAGAYFAFYRTGVGESKPSGGPDTVQAAANALPGPPVQPIAADSGASRTGAAPAAESTSAPAPVSASKQADTNPAARQLAAPGGRRVPPRSSRRSAAAPPKTEPTAQNPPPTSQAAQPTPTNQQAAAVNQQPGAAPSAAPSAVAPPPAAATAFITIGSRPSSAMTINGHSVANPITNFEVPAGAVRIHFQVTDSTGVWTVDQEFTLSAGEHRNFGYVRLRHP